MFQDPVRSQFGDRVSDSGEGRWTIKAAIDEGVPAYVLSSALYERFSSRGEADFADRLLSAMRYEFGGLDVILGLLSMYSTRPCMAPDTQREDGRRRQRTTDCMRLGSRSISCSNRRSRWSGSS
jgi:hypothetical protein